MICDAYAKKYDHVHTVHKSNGGPSDARKAGLQTACGKYVTFVDSDDYVNPLYLELLLKGIAKGADMAICGFVNVYDDNGISWLDKVQVPIEITTSQHVLVEVLYQGFHDVSPWGILLLTDFARKYPFPKGKHFEDLYTTYHYYLDTAKTALIRTPLYYYFQRSDSIMSRRNEAFIYDQLEASDLLVKACQGRGKDIERAAVNKQFSNYCRIILLVSDLKKRYPEIYQHIVKTIKEERFVILFDSHARKKNRLAALALLGGITGLKIAFNIRR